MKAVCFKDEAVERPWTANSAPSLDSPCSKAEFKLTKLRVK